MGSMAQDARHEKILSECNQRVSNLKFEIKETEEKLKQLKENLKEAEKRLEQQEYIGFIRD